MQHFLKALAGAAWAWIVASKLFEELFIAVNDPDAAFHVCLGRESSATLTGTFESRIDRGRCGALNTSAVKVVAAR